MSLAASFDWTAIPGTYPDGCDITPPCCQDPHATAADALPIARSVDVPTAPEPVPAAVGFQPRPYQQDSESGVWREWDSGKRSTLGIMATGGGKTIVFGMIAKTAIVERAGRVLVLAHREELLEQAQSKLAFVGVHSAIEKADQKARTSISLAARDYFHRRDIRCVVASVQSMKGRRLESWPRDYFTHMVIDEAHHATASSYKAIVRHFAAAKQLGVTATPLRSDKTNLGAVYESVAFDYPLPWMIGQGMLAPIVWEKSEEQIDLRQVNACAGDLNQGDLEDAIGPHVERMVNAIRERIGDRRGIMFTPGRKKVSQKIRPCEAFALGLRKVGIPAEAVWGDHPNRINIVRRFRAGEFQILCGTPGLLGEGVDFPFASVGILGCPTMSPGMFAQMVGRITRLSPETGKVDALIIDFDWLINKHKLCSAFNLVRPNGSEDAARIAAAIIASGEETDILKAADLAEDRAAKLIAERELAKAKAEEIKQAREDSEKAKRDRLARDPINLRVREGASGLEFRRFDPFASASSLAGGAARGSGRPATPIQVRKLVDDYGVPREEAAALDHEGAAEMIRWSFQRYQKGLSPLWLVKALCARGVEQLKVLSMSKSHAFELWNRMGGGKRRSG